MKQYFSYFKIWFLVLALLGIVTGLACVKEYVDTHKERINSRTPAQRVYDGGDVLTDAEEGKLEELIAKRERQTGCDFVIVTINHSVLSQYGYDTDYYWEIAMRDYADDFYDSNFFGFDQTGGDGSLLLDNWYEGEEGTWLSTGGRVYEHYTDRMIADVLDAVSEKVETSPYLAYKAYVESVYREMTGRNNRIMKWLVLLVPAVVCFIFIRANIKPRAGEKTVNSRTYVNGGKAKMKEERDVYLRKTISQRRIETSSSGGGRSGGGHRSSGGFSHGGGGRRR